VRAERLELGLDHATVGGVLIRRWGLPDRLADAVAHHHDPDATGAAAIVRLADLLVHYQHDRAVKSGDLLEAARHVGLDETGLRSIMYELPGGTGARTRQADPCPLSPAELSALRKLAEGKRYDEIARELGRATSTVRTHLHNAYRKLGVTDRAQAVLMAAERGWL
jgi:DNA-binding NarL/FixJ family response regulator